MLSVFVMCPIRISFSFQVIRFPLSLLAFCFAFLNAEAMAAPMVPLINNQLMLPCAESALHINSMNSEY
jgi:hypothetical protein